MTVNNSQTRDTTSNKLRTLRIVPAADTIEQIAKWVGICLAAITTVIGMIRGWYHSRFKGVHKRIDELKVDLSDQDKTVSKHGEKINEHNSQLAVLNTHVENGNDQRDKIEKSIDRLHDKLDKVISGN